jgi:hypothetical protein
MAFVIAGGNRTICKHWHCFIDLCATSVGQGIFNALPSTWLFVARPKWSGRNVALKHLLLLAVALASFTIDFLHISIYNNL